MKNFLFIVIAIVSLSCHAYADGSKTKPSQDPINLVFHQNNDPGSVHRAPMEINLEVFYDVDTHILIVSGECDAEVNLYHGDRLIGHSDSVNTTFNISENTGIYMVEIIADSWSAFGYIEI